MNNCQQTFHSCVSSILPSPTRRIYLLVWLGVRPWFVSSFFWLPSTLRGHVMRRWNVELTFYSFKEKWIIEITGLRGEFETIEERIKNEMPVPRLYRIKTLKTCW
mmetsp:Transcript_12499/g.14309  ORF Transcript_12499/g.14309 Transcript_12499/m.14309 type:complete len:105 (+) Transcript_12499:159-473(+)